MRLYRQEGLDDVRVTQADVIAWCKRTREAIREFERAIRDDDVNALHDWAHEASGCAAELENIGDTTRDHG